MAKIFISYRRGDSIAYAGRIYDHLSQHFGADKVFMDIGGIAPGEDFVKVLDARVADSDVVIALIGPGWLNACDDRGRRIDQPDDFVRYELAAALEHGKRLIPVLVGGAMMPGADQLPPALARLARCQAHPVDDSRFAYDLDALIRSIEHRPSLLGQFMELATAERWRRWRQASTAGVALLMLCLGWVQLFDVFGLDARIQSYTMALGDLVASTPVSDRIVIVGFDEKTEARLGPPGPGWRGEHARLVDQLAAAGARVIVFDLFFETPGAADAELVAAIERARQRGSQVYIGVRRLVAGRAAVVPELGEAASGLGLLCIGGRIGYASVAPLAVVKPLPPPQTGSTAPAADSGQFIALALLALGASPDTLAGVTLGEETVISDDKHRILYQGLLEPAKVQVEASGELSEDCPLLSAGDGVAEAMIRMAAAGAWRDPARRYDYEQVAGPVAAFKPGQLEGKIVLIGDARPGQDEFWIRRGLDAERRHGIELHADVVNNLAQAIQVRRLDTLPQFLLMLLLAAAGAWLRLARPGTPTVVRWLLVASLLLGYLGLAIVLYTGYGLLLNTAYQIGAFLLAYWLLGRVAARAAHPA
jgi:CHASE2 domain-containing sensor protein